MVSKKVAELDFIELILLTMRYKKIIIFTILIASLISFFFIFSFISTIKESKKKILTINMLFNDEIEMSALSNITSVTDIEKLKDKFVSVDALTKRLSSAKNYESWKNKNEDLANYFSQNRSHRVEISSFNQLVIRYTQQKEYDAILSFINHTLSTNQDLMDKFVEKIIERNFNRANIKIASLKNEIIIFEKKLQILEDLSMTSFGENKEIYYKELVESYANIENNHYLIKNLNVEIKNLENLKKQNFSKNYNMFGIELGDISIRPVPDDRVKLYQKNPNILYIIIPIIDVILIVLMIIFFRIREEYLFRKAN